MKENNENGTPDISGVSQEIHDAIKSDLQPAPGSMENCNSILCDKRIGISVSNNEELEELGYSTIHLTDLLIEVIRNLLINGGTIVYAGGICKREVNMTSSEGDAGKKDYTYLFSDLAFQYRDKKDSKKKYFEYYIGFPFYCLWTEDHEAYFKKCRTEIIKVPPPAELSIDTQKYLPYNTMEEKLIWARSITEMRKTMISNTDVRILVGGRLSDYKGKMPGIIEEAKITLQQNKPLYLIGALGGACKEIINTLKGNNFTYTNNSFHQSTEYLEFKKQYNKLEKDLIDLRNRCLVFQRIWYRKNISIEWPHR